MPRWDIEFFARFSAVLIYLSGAGIRVGLHGYAGDSPYRGDLTTYRMIYNPPPHTAHTYQILFDAVPSLILLNPNCSDMLPQRKWPPEYYVDLARRLLSRFPNVWIGLTGAPEEKNSVEQLVSQVGSSRCCCLAGRTTLRQLLVLYGLAEALVTNDSGPAHFAAVTLVDVLTLFGSETPKLFGSLGRCTHFVRLGLPCSPCISACNNRLSPCRNNVCMKNISADRVFAKVCELYEERTAVGRKGA